MTTKPRSSHLRDIKPWPWWGIVTFWFGLTVTFAACLYALSLQSPDKPYRSTVIKICSSGYVVRQDNEGHSFVENNWYRYPIDADKIKDACQ